MKTLIKIILICMSINTFGQEGIKFDVENLSKPEKLIFKREYNDIYKMLILSDVNMSLYDVKNGNFDFPFNIIARSDAPDSLVSFGYHSFFNGMYQAYADHRPFVLSPDIVWLLISQGFARHINTNSEALRHRIVNFEGKYSLIVTSGQLTLDSPPGEWETIFPEFTKQIAQHTGDDLLNLLSSDFSTTTPAEKVASEITIMEAMKPYFEFVVFRIVCGIPEITLKGTPEDWQKILDKTKKLGKYDLQWWTNELIPVLQEFIKASKGDIDKDFWRNMFKYHSQKKYGAPNIIDGWIVKFFPYDKDGKRNNLRQLEGGDNLPEEIVKVDLKYEEITDGSAKITPLELWAGFVGLEENPVDFTLTPEIGWMIRKKDTKNEAIINKFENDNIKNARGGIQIRVDSFPPELFELKHIKNLNIEFINKINIPDSVNKLEIDYLKISGKISDKGKERIDSLLPKTNLTINGKKYDHKF